MQLIKNLQLQNQCKTFSINKIKKPISGFCQLNTFLQPLANIYSLTIDFQTMFFFYRLYLKGENPYKVQLSWVTSVLLDFCTRDINGLIFLTKDPNRGSFRVCHFIFGNYRENKALPLEIPQNCAKPLGNSLITLGSSTSFLLDPCLDYLHMLFLQYHGHFMSSTPSPLPACLDFFWNSTISLL